MVVPEEGADHWVEATRGCSLPATSHLLRRSGYSAQGHTRRSRWSRSERPSQASSSATGNHAVIVLLRYTRATFRPCHFLPRSSVDLFPMSDRGVSYRGCPAVRELVSNTCVGSYVLGFGFIWPVLTTRYCVVDIADVSVVATLLCSDTRVIS